MEHCLTNADEIDFILGTYWNSNKNKIKNLSNNSIDSFKIQIVLGCDATSLTNFIRLIIMMKMNS